MTRWQKILVATDFSPPADVALRSAERLARDGGGRLIVVHVVEPIPAGYSLRPSARGIVDLESEAERGAGRMLERIVGESRRRRARVRGVLRVGKPWSQILDVAEEVDADVICLGISGRSAFERLLMGSTAENVVRRSHVPVLVTRHAALGSVRKVAVPVDFDPGSRQALRFAMEAFPARTEITAVHVAVPVSAFDPMVGIIVPDEAAIAEELESYLGKKAVERTRPEVRVQSDLTSGILQHASERDAGLILISTHGRRGMARALLGNTAEKVVRHSDRPVLVLPGPGRSWSPADVRPRSAAATRGRKTKAKRPSARPKGRGERGPWTGQAHTGRGGPAGRRGAGSTAGKRKGGRKTRPGEGG